MNRSTWAPACAILVAVAALAAESPLTQQIAAQLRPNDLKADVSFLASDALEGRGTPSPGLDIAAEFIAAEFRRAGLEAAGNDGYFQSAPFVSVTPNPEGLQITLEIGGSPMPVDPASLAIAEAAALDQKNAPAIVSPQSGLEKLTAEQVRGKVLVVPAEASGGRRRRLSPALLDRLRPALVLLQTQASAARGPNREAQLRETSNTAIPIVNVWDKKIWSAVATAKPGKMTVSAHMAAPAERQVKLRNVVGVLRGSDASLQDTYVLITGHYDHLGVRGTGEGDRIYNGANDDASGTASVIEIARTLAALPTRPRRTIVFVALFGEELGLLGSRYYARHPAFPLAKTVADLNLEQMGRTDDVTGPRVGILNATGFDYTDMTGVLARAGAEFGVKVLKDEESSDAFFARSDNQAFADAGVPSHTLSVGYVFPDYHQPGDEWQKIDYDNLSKVDRAVALGVFRIADSVEPPRWNTANPKTAPYVKSR